MDNTRPGEAHLQDREDICVDAIVGKCNARVPGIGAERAVLSILSATQATNHRAGFSNAPDNTWA